MKLRNRRRVALTGCIIAIVSIWGAVLPWLSSYHHVQERLQFLDDRGIDPSAMFYTELEAMEPILNRIEGRSNHSESGTSL
ncbi:hypothetical protein LF1_47590 [Rubripirellula obstinata]|uniref:Uncharacterized protein n=1 Tax=Rubripirellula obstinata TaxID=406547 RepID=A0A5B1CLX3_9BACT|nr:hypothetical protein [Rubripirellula obstinata]KAA1262197.1 hypothetical protein LF1_47590 [Rubripirellula obstinata]